MNIESLWKPLETYTVKTTSMAASFDAMEHSPRVLMVAEKPSVALAIANALSQGRKKTTGVPPLRTHEMFVFFPPARRVCSVAVTGVCGHMFSLDFESGGRSSHADLAAVYSARTRKVEEELSGKLGVIRHLQRSAEGAEWVVLWLDCDREGENICFVRHGLEHVPRLERASRDSGCLACSERC